MFRSSLAMMKVSAVVLLTLPLTVASLNAQTANPGDDPDVSQTPPGAVNDTPTVWS